MNNWIPLSEVDFNDKSIHQYHVDTRDFHVMIDKTPYVHPHVGKIAPSIERFFYHDSATVVSTLIRWKYESGGDKEWRFFRTEGDNSWHLKYIRLYRHGDKFLFCNKENQTLSSIFIQAKGESV